MELKEFLDLLGISEEEYENEWKIELDSPIKTLKHCIFCNTKTIQYFFNAVGKSWKYLNTLNESAIVLEVFCSSCSTKTQFNWNLSDNLDNWENN
jgi:hypothetical protein